MKENRTKVLIKRPVSDVFAFAINPENTPKWIDDIVKEETNEWPIKLGSMYRNQRKTGEWAEYKVAELEENKTFLLIKDDNNVHVKYTLTAIDPSTTELEFYVWVEHGDLDLPHAQEWLNNLKRIVES